MYLTVSIFLCVRTCIDVCIFIQNKLCCNFNVSNTKLTHMLNILDKFNMDVTFGKCNK